MNREVEGHWLIQCLGLFAGSPCRCLAEALPPLSLRLFGRSVLHALPGPEARDMPTRAMPVRLRERPAGLARTRELSRVRAVQPLERVPRLAGRPRGLKPCVTSWPRVRRPPAPLFGEGTGGEAGGGTGGTGGTRRGKEMDTFTAETWGSGSGRRSRPDPKGDRQREGPRRRDRSAAQRQRRERRTRTRSATAAGGRRGRGAERADPAETSRSSRALPSGSPSRRPGPDVGQTGANELQGLSITSPEPAAIGWPSRRGGLLL